VLVVAFHGESLVLANIRGRGYTVPSGHIESGETPEQTAVRETYEETGGRIAPQTLRHIGFHTFSDLSGPREGILRACPVYVADIAYFDPLPVGSESDGYILVAPADISNRYFIWDDLTASFFEHALSERAVIA
jgi:8-oxo-dGTP diphosphatase